MSTHRYIGIMSGTSADGADFGILRCEPSSIALEATLHLPFEDALHEQITQCFTPGHNEIDRMGALSQTLAEISATGVNTLLASHNLNPKDIRAIGHHGQTLRHRPEHAAPFTLQIGDASRLAALTGIPVVSDFRSKDMALGGQGAPLAPRFHDIMLSLNQQASPAAVLNLGGIGNITYRDHILLGFDTGPANGLLDSWHQQHRQARFDDNGRWAASGQACEALITQWLAHPYFAKPYPKSTGKEEFTDEWLNHTLADHTHVSALRPEDVQASLVELTARSVALAVSQLPKRPTAVFVCGGGVHNGYLMQRLRDALPSICVETTALLGVDPDWVEAAAFAWLAHCRMEHIALDYTHITGASRPCVLGSVTTAD